MVARLHIDQGNVVTPTILRLTDYDGLDASTLPSRQQRILATIRDWVAAHGCPPSTRQIGDAVGLRSTSSVSKQLDVLPFLSGATHGRSSDNNVTVPVVGGIAAGTPILAEARR